MSDQSKTAIQKIYPTDENCQLTACERVPTSYARCYSSWIDGLIPEDIEAQGVKTWIAEKFGYVDKVIQLQTDDTETEICDAATEYPIVMPWLVGQIQCHRLLKMQLESTEVIIKF